MNHGRIFWALVASLITIAGATLGTAEYRLSASLRKPIDAEFFAVRGGANLSGAPWAVSSQISRLDRCAASQSTLTAAFYPKLARDNLATACLNLARQSLDQTPTMSVAHYAAAVSLAQLGDIAFLSALLASYQTAPFEGWLAERRAKLGLTHLQDLPPPNLKALQMDLALSLATPGYSEAIAIYYARNEEKRPFILSVAESLPPEAQRTFYNLVEKYMSPRDKQS